MTKPLPTLKGQRIRLRPLGPRDADAMFASIHDPESARLTGSHGTFTLEGVRAHCARVAEAPDRVDYAIVAAEDPEGPALGEVVLNDLDPDNGVINFRIGMFGPGNIGRGLGTEATRMIVDYAFESLDVNRIELEVYAFNPRAARVYDKVGFVREGVRRAALRWEGAYVDAIVMGMLRSDWEAKRGD